MTLERLNGLPAAAAMRVLLECCGSTTWAARLTALRPYVSADDVQVTAAREWLKLGEADWLEAFAAHPRIGERSASAASAREQASVGSAGQETRAALAAGNAEYEKRFGFIFIVFASDKTPEAIRELLQQRLHNTREQELTNAATEQMKITRLRLERLLSS